MIAIDKYILIKRIKEEVKSPGGLIIPDSANTEQEVYEIVHMGCEADLTLLYVEIEDKVIIKRYAGQDVKVDGESYKVIAYEDILLVLR